MKRRTSLIVDTNLMAKAAKALGTKGPSETVRRALEAAVRRQQLQSLAAWDFPDSAPQDLREMRRPRAFPD